MRVHRRKTGSKKELSLKDRPAFRSERQVHETTPFFAELHGRRIDLCEALELLVRELGSVEIARIEVCDVPKPLPVRETDDASVAIDQAVGLEPFQDPIDVHRRESGRVGELLLRNRELVGS